MNNRNIARKMMISGITLLAATVGFQAAAQDTAAFEAKLRQLVPETSKIDSIGESAMPGVMEVSINGRTVYAYGAGDYLLLGDAYDVARKVSLADEKRNAAMAEMLKEIKPEDTVVMKGAESKRVITVFTDIDCGYCRKLHNEIPALNAAGVEVRYLAFPRAGVGSNSYKKLVSVWCADDSADAMTAAKRGQDPAPKECANPVAQQYQMGQQAGVTGTPTMILDDGTVIPGYVPAARLTEQLGLK